MSVYFQVSAGFSLFFGTPFLFSLSLNTTNKYIGYIFKPTKSLKKISRVFRTLAQAQNYINYLYSRYPESKVKRPVLDVNQPPLF